MIHQTHPAANGGFTLLEVLIAVTLMALMAVGLWGAFRIGLHSWSQGTEFIDANQRHRNMLDLVQKQMASIYPLYTQPDLQNGHAKFPIFSGAEMNVSFVSLNSLQFHESPGLTLVSYEVSSDSNGRSELVEKETRYTGQPLDDIADNLSKGVSIFQNLSSCTIEYFDPGDNDHPAQWVREWEGEDKLKLPVAIAMEAIFHDPQGNSLSRRIVAPIKAEATDFRFNPSNILNGFMGAR